jgi:predicted enzyme related to lactoylglutathione lyase
MIQSLDHIQLAIPAGAEDRVRPFYCDLLGMTEVPKPAPMQGRGGFWVVAGALQVHFGVDPVFTPATKAHPAFVVSDLDALVRRLVDAGHPVTWDTALPDVRRAFTADPVGNRIELIAA